MKVWLVLPRGESPNLEPCVLLRCFPTSKTPDCWHGDAPSQKSVHGQEILHTPLQQSRFLMHSRSTKALRNSAVMKPLYLYLTSTLQTVLTAGPSVPPHSILGNPCYSPQEAQVAWGWVVLLWISERCFQPFRAGGSQALVSKGIMRGIFFKMQIPSFHSQEFSRCGWDNDQCFNITELIPG